MMLSSSGPGRFRFARIHSEYCSDECGNCRDFETPHPVKIRKIGDDKIKYVENKITAGMSPFVWERNLDEKIQVSEEIWKRHDNEVPTLEWLVKLQLRSWIRLEKVNLSHFRPTFLHCRILEIKQCFSDSNTRENRIKLMETLTLVRLDHTCVLDFLRAFDTCNVKAIKSLEVYGDKFFSFLSYIAAGIFMNSPPIKVDHLYIKFATIADSFILKFETQHFSMYHCELEYSTLAKLIVKCNRVYSCSAWVIIHESQRNVIEEVMTRGSRRIRDFLRSKKSYRAHIEIIATDLWIVREFEFKRRSCVFTIKIGNTYVVLRYCREFCSYTNLFPVCRCDDHRRH